MKNVTRPWKPAELFNSQQMTNSHLVSMTHIITFTISTSFLRQGTRSWKWIRYILLSKGQFATGSYIHPLTSINRLRGRVVKGVGHIDHVRSYGVREVVSSIPDRGNIVG